MIYFDNAATTFPKPQNVITVVNTAVSYYGGNPGRAGHDMAIRLSQQVYNVRKKVAEFFNAETENVAFTFNCTLALNMAIKGVMNDGGHILCSCLEHNAVIRPIYKLFKDGKINYDVVQICDEDEDTVNAFKNMIKSDTKAIVCTHASNVAGRVLPIEKLGELCRQQGVIFIVDAAQSAGVLPIDMKKCNINILCMPGHKGLYGTTGSGIIILNGNIRLDTIVEGGTGSVSVELNQPDFYPDRLEAGTVNTVGILSIGAGIDFITRTGIKNIYNHEHKLCKIVYEELKKIDGIIFYEGLKKINSPIVSFNIEGAPSDMVVGKLNEAGFALRGGLHCATLAHNYYNTADIGMVRFSPSVFSTAGQIELFVKNVRNLIKKFPNAIEI